MIDVKTLNDFVGKNKELIWKWAAFAVFFTYFWRTYNVFTAIPAYGDALEVVWGILWYNHALTEWVNPFYYPYIFHPEGWQLGILAHTPLLFAIAQPFYFLGGELFAYNAIAIIPFFISYIGALRFFRHYSKSTLTIIVVSLVFTFISMRSSRAGGHLHILWATSFFPWLGDHLLHWHEQEIESVKHKHVLLSGVYFGLMASFSLYSIFLAPIIFLLLGQRLFLRQTYKQLSVVALIAMLISSTALLPYYFATQNESINPPSFQELTFWGASINHLFIPSAGHPVPQIRQIANYFQANQGGESSSLNMGMITLVLALFGLVGGVWNGQKNVGTRRVLFLSLILALGPVLKLNGDIIEFNQLEWLNRQLWRFGYLLKPDVFYSEILPQNYVASIPLPDYIFIILIPFWEGARVAVRFAFVALLGALGFVAIGLDRLPKWLRWAFMLVWLVEILPFTTGNLKLDFDHLHPAHAWLNAQAIQPREGVLDFRSGIIHGPIPLYNSWQTKIPTASAIGSFRPSQSQTLFSQTHDLANQPPDFLAQLFQAYNIRYLVVHNKPNQEHLVWDYLQANTEQFTPIDCFVPPADYQSPWSHPICIAEVKAHATVSNVFPIYGFSAPEPWGMWTIEDRPRFNFVATAQKPHSLEAELFPNCAEGENQSLTLFYNGEILQELAWENCDPLSFQVTIPAENMQIGFNEMHFELGYAKSPAELGTGNDPRALGVGFSRLAIRPID